MYLIGRSSSDKTLSLNIFVKGTSAVGIRKKSSLFFISNKSSLNLGNCPVPIKDFEFTIKGTLTYVYL